jgi:hypothetical protein
MPIDNNIDITLDELKTIIHGLRMSTLSFVEDNAIDEIKAMIKALPLPEAIDKLVTIPMGIKGIQRDVGNIMRLIELYGKRDIEFKTRYKSRTGLPPRYKVLDWRSKMKANAKIIRDMVKVSSDIDNSGHGEISGRINKFASNMIQDKFDEVEFEKIAMELKNSGLEKEAQFWSGVKGFMGGALGKVKDIATDVWQAGKAGGLEEQFNAIYKQLEAFKVKVGQFASQVKDPTLQQKMGNLYQSIELGEQQINKAAADVKGTSQVAQPEAQTPRAATPTASPNIDVTRMDRKQLGQLYTQIWQELSKRKKQPVAEVPQVKTPAGTPAPVNV